MAGEIESDSVSPVNINLDRYRQLVRNYIDKHQYDTALFWADKVVSLSKGCAGDIYWYAQSMFLTSQFHRAINQLKNQGLEKKYLACRYLVARCHYECKEWEEALEVLDQPALIRRPLPNISVDNAPPSPPPVGMPTDNLESSINLLRGKVYEAMDNRSLACECFREALRHDIYCYEAFENLVNHHMMSAQEERELIEQLPFSKQCPEDEVEFVRFLYENKLKKYQRPSELAIPDTLSFLNDNLDVVVSLAERHYYNCDFRECHKITTAVLNKDPYNSQCLPLHIAVLVELKKSNTLFYLAHKLVDLYPTKAVAWFAVGCYYFLVGKNDPARRYLSKATTLDRVYGPAWLAFGHSFAVENEHDQAMAAYFTASQLMKGCHLPVLYIGLEYGLTNNTRLAERFFSQALSLAPDDPFVLHEMGVIAYQNADYGQAEKYFRMALEKVQVISREIMAEKWEPLLNNLGHTCRKLKKYDEALEYHRQSLVLFPQNPATMSAIGYVFLLTSRSAEAVDYFHKALGLRRDDTFSTTMLSNAIEQLMSEMSPCDGVPDILPPYTYAGKLDVSNTGRSSVAGDEGSFTSPTTPSDLVTPPPRIPPPLPTSTTPTGDDSSLLDSSSMAIDTDMEDA